MRLNRVEQIAAELEDFIRQYFQVPADDEFFTRVVNLWEEGYVDSIGVVETMAHIEETYEITLPEEIVFDPKFTHINGMAELIGRLVQK